MCTRLIWLLVQASQEVYVGTQLMLPFRISYHCKELARLVQRLTIGYKAGESASFQLTCVSPWLAEHYLVMAPPKGFCS